MRPLLASLVALLLASPAQAAAPWSGATGITETSRSASGPEPLTSADGTTAVFYRREGGGVPGGVCAFVSRAPGAAAFGSPHLLHGGCAGAVTYARRSVAALTLTSTRRGSTYSVAFGTTRGSFGAAKRMVTSPRVRRAVIAGNSAGMLAVAWFEDRGTANDRVWLRLRRPGGRFGAPILVAQDRVRSVAVAVGERGDLLVAWDARGAIRARLRAPRRGTFGRTESIRSEDAYFAALNAALLPSGRAMLGWSAQFLSEGGDRGDRFTQVAVRPAGAARFRPAQLLERDARGSIELGNLQLVASRTGAPAAAWSGHDGDHAVVRVSEADAHGVFGAPVSASPAGQDAHLTSVSRGPDGQLAVLWSRGLDTPSDVFASVRPAGGAFGPAELVSDGDDARSGRLAFHPGGRLTAVWEDTDGVGDARVRRVFAADRG